MRALALSLGVVLLACGPAPTATPPVVLPDAGRPCTEPADDAWRSCSGIPFAAPTCSPDGAGYCCPLAGPSCGCSARGGFSLDTCGCAFQTICDLHPSGWRYATDEHGCTVVSVGAETTHCF